MAKMVLPRVLAMIMCDDVVEAEDEIGIFHLTGVRTAVEAPPLPTVHSFCVFVQMSGHQGEASCHVIIVSSESAEVIGEADSQMIAFEDPRIAVSVVFHLDSCVFTVPGLYYVEIYHERKVIGERRLFRLED